MSVSVGLQRDLAEAPARAKTRFRWKRAGLAGIGLVLAAGAITLGYDWWTTGRFIESTDDAYVGGNVTAVAAHIPALVAAVLVEDNQHVAANQLLIRLDARDYRATEARARATLDGRRESLASLQAQYAGQEAAVRQQQADIASRTAEATFARLDAGRYRALAVTSAGTRQDAERADSHEKQAGAALAASMAGLDAAQQKLVALQADIGQAQADVASAKADVTLAQLNLGWTEIRSPIAGYVGNRSAQVGAYVSAGSYLVSVVPDNGLWVDANFKEDQLARMAPGRPAVVVADVLPSHPFKGHVVSLAPGTGGVFSVIPPENATGNFTKVVQRVPVRVQLDPGDPMLPLLRPGLSVVVRVDTRSQAEMGK